MASLCSRVSPLARLIGYSLPRLSVTEVRREDCVMNLKDILKRDANGLLAAIIQHHQTGQVLMLGYMNDESLDYTLREQKACFWSRSRQELWLKGETSGNYLHVKEIRVDCDADALLLQCEPVGPTCHTGETSCFYRTVENNGKLRLTGDGVATE
jgi:phosphoribosyl-AMP cyclohydrolase